MPDKAATRIRQDQAAPAAFPRRPNDEATSGARFAPDVLIACLALFTREGFRLQDLLTLPAP